MEAPRVLYRPVPPTIGDKFSLAASPFLFALAIIIAKVALNGGVYVFTFNAIRNTFAFVMTYVVRNVRGLNKRTVSWSNCDASLLQWSFLCGVSNALGMTCSALALSQLNTAMFSFLLGLTVVMTPLMSHFLPYKSVRVNALGWFAVTLSIVGTLFLEGCARDPSQCLSNGNWFSVVALGAAFFYSLYAYLIGLGSDYVEPGTLTQGSLLVSCIALICICLVTILFREEGEDAGNISYFYLSPVQYACVTGVAVLEALAWQFETRAVTAVGASKAAMAIATEAPMTTILAYFLLSEQLTTYQYVGCALVFLAAIIATFDAPEDSEHRKDLPTTSTDEEQGEGEEGLGLLLRPAPGSLGGMIVGSVVDEVTDDSLL
jgi:drug/metabolite transporter (DMT)-like permease